MPLKAMDIKYINTSILGFKRNCTACFFAPGDMNDKFPAGRRKIGCGPVSCFYLKLKTKQPRI